MNTVHLGPEDLLAAARAFLGTEPVLRDPGGLVAAAAQPATSWEGVPLYPSLDEKAAVLLVGVVSHHPLLDGNKRLGWVSTRLFYALNGRRLSMPVDDAVELVLAVADGSIREVRVIAARLAAATS
ncbi:type II toxin-antitoxin system death-on-curing family toxin [Cellulomonas denverensis]|uniref:type II toxin-antitoxin system death-on-curing family toxin n=1 Tax=Cellulomonas denverensis TaxID=264297 RepID=UPI0019429757|nr:Fic family protein [Cellulomonas denverensis]